MNHEELIHIYGKDVIEALSSIVKWKYDDFHKVMLAEFSVDKHYAGSFSKVVKKQKLFSTNIERHPKVMAAWWPWGHGATVSIRLFLTDTSPFVAKTGFIYKLSRLFA